MVSRSAISVNPALNFKSQKAAMLDKLQGMRDAGANVVYPVELNHPSTFGDSMRKILGTWLVVNSVIVLLTQVKSMSRALKWKIS